MLLYLSNWENEKRMEGKYLPLSFFNPTSFFYILIFHSWAIIGKNLEKTGLCALKLLEIVAILFESTAVKNNTVR